MARIQSTAEMFRIAIEGTKAQVRQELIRTARREHERVMTTDPKPSSSYRIVDGVRDAPLEGVRADGVVVYRFPRLEQVVQFAMETLFDLSPVDSGEYRSAHTIFMNGREVANLDGYKSGDDVTITNYVPYARKIEVGKMTMRVPGTDRVYQQARRKVMSRWGNVAEVQFTYRGIVGGSQVNQAKAASFGQPWYWGGAASRAASGVAESAIKKKHGQAHNRSELRFPVLIIKER